MAHPPASAARIAVALLLLASPAVAGSIDFADPIRVPTGTDPAALATADFNGDGHQDVVAVHRTSDDAWIFFGDGSGGLSFVQSFGVGNFPQGVIAVDLDGNGIVDLANTAVPFNSGTVSIWLGNGDGTFSPGEVLTADDGTRSLLAADLNGDGVLDLVATNPTRGNISSYLGDGDGTFGAEERTAVGFASSFPTDLAIADFNGNGVRDVVTSNAQSVDHSLGRVFGDGDGTFSGLNTFPSTCTRPESVVDGDFDGNGDPDIAFCCFASDQVGVMLGDGSGGFSSPVLHDFAPDAGNPYWIQAIDLDQDGREELVTANNGSFSYLRGRADGSFEAPRHVPLATATFFGATKADFDGDGWEDLVFANFGEDEVVLFLNRSGACGAAACPLTLTSSAGGVLGWVPSTAALGYDVIRGDLPLLRSSGGDFAQATGTCLASGIPDLSFTDPALPGPGDGYWYLVREVTALGAGSYDVFAGNLAAGRDGGIAASGNDCP